jgi:hypothetical protein
MKEFKHLKSFESFSNQSDVEIIEENVFRKFFKGHATSKEEEEAAKNFLALLAEVENKIKDNPENLSLSQGGGKEFNADAWEKAKESILGKAKENNYKGGLRITKSKKDDKVYVVYGKGFSGLEKVAMGASHRRDNPLG